MSTWGIGDTHSFCVLYRALSPSCWSIQSSGPYPAGTIIMPLYRSAHWDGRGLVTFQGDPTSSARARIHITAGLTPALHKNNHTKRYPDSSPTTDNTTQLLPPLDTIAMATRGQNQHENTDCTHIRVKGTKWPLGQELALWPQWVRWRKEGKTLIHTDNRHSEKQTILGKQFSFQ